MKKRLIILTLIAFQFISSNYVIGQTIELEKENLNRMIQSGELDQSNMKKVKTAWDKLENNSGYPELPYNKTTERVEFITIENYSDLSKKEIYFRVKEWIAITYGSIDAVLHYEEFETGKIIVKGWFSITVDDILVNFWGDPKEFVKNLKCNYTVIITVKEGKLKMAFTNIEYESKTGGYISGSTYVPTRTITYSITGLYPVTSKEYTTWPNRMSTLKETADEIQLQQRSIKNYINLTKRDSDF